ncbi:hypothetical protein [Nannocystis sp.]|uniref:hypothetical protein n=1 Tax=Nannocystis sp. TaxID=1962667 RepID=UPI002422AF1F|nr:hypothetical protein [Nannocystis sp.]MBK7826423.1 hypothetical protein [Nannocystis sp.]MBK9757940.1 hypothetical protein [Nannocystis sp.]
MAITTKNRKQLKAYFVKNAIPTEGNFSDLVDAQLNQAEDGVFKLPGEPLSVVAGPGEQRRALRFYSTYPAANPDWQISLAPAQDPGNPASVRPGFGVSDGAGRTRLYIDPATGNLGVGTNNPTDRLTVSDGDLRIEGEGYQRLKILAFNAGIELVARNPGGTPHIDFTQGLLDNPDYGLRLIATDNKVLHVQSGLGPATLRVQGDLEVDGQLARLDLREQAAATVRAHDLLFGHSGRHGAPGRALVDGSDALIVNFAGDWSRTDIQSPLHVSGAVGIGTTAPAGPLDVRVAGTGTWDRLVVTASDAWNNGNQHVTIGAGGAGGIMFNNPHVSWIAGEKRASIRYGQSLPNKAWWDVGLRENDAFTFVAAGSPTALSILGSGDVAVTRDLDYGGKLGKLDVKEQGAVTLRAADLQFGHSGRRGAPGRALVDGKEALIVNYGADWSRTDIHGPALLTGSLTVNGDTNLANLRVNQNASVAGNLEVNGQASLGWAQPTADFNQPLRSGFYQWDNPAGRVPDTAHPWVHMISVRHANPGNHHALQIAASYAENDKLYFRKVARELVAASSPWNEVATVTNGVLRIGGWSLEASANSLLVKCGAQLVARFSIEHDRFMVFRNINGQAPYFYYNALGISGT